MPCTPRSYCPEQYDQELYQEPAASPTRELLPLQSSHSSQTDLHQTLQEEPCSTAMNSSQGNQQLQPSTSSMWRGKKLCQWQEYKHFFFPALSPQEQRISEKNTRFSVQPCKKQWACGTSKQTEIIAYRKKGIFSASYCGIHFQATVRGSL